MATAQKTAPAKKGKSIMGIKVPKKKPVIRRAHLADEKYTGKEPEWDTERAAKMDDKEFDHFLAKSFTYYNYHYTSKDLKPELVKWLQEQEYFEFSKQDLSKIIRSRWVPITVCSLIMAHRKGMPFRERSLAFIQRHLQEVILKFDYYNEDDEIGRAHV